MDKAKWPTQHSVQSSFYALFFSQVARDVDIVAAGGAALRRPFKGSAGGDPLIKASVLHSIPHSFSDEPRFQICEWSQLARAFSSHASM
jgi:hypothetical protein